MGLVFVDCEAYGGCPATGHLTEFGAVVYPSKKTFDGRIVESKPSVEKLRDSTAWQQADSGSRKAGVLGVCNMLAENVEGRPVFVSDNAAFDWQWINDGFWRTLGYNPFGHSARRISDFYAGLVGDFHARKNGNGFVSRRMTTIR